jgi:hypothetical protein
LTSDPIAPPASLDSRWMTDGDRAHESRAVDEGAWIYLIGSTPDSSGAGSLRQQVIQACEEGGWPAVSLPLPGAGHPPDPGDLFEGVRHAVGHADCVVALLGEAAETTDAELALAYSHRRPIVGMRGSGDGPADSEMQAMLTSYERARVIVCDDVGECAAELRAVLDDPEFAATIRLAAGEHASPGL